MQEGSLLKRIGSVGIAAPFRGVVGVVQADRDEVADVAERAPSRAPSAPPAAPRIDAGELVDGSAAKAVAGDVGDVAERSRTPPSASRMPGFSWPGGPKRTNFIRYPSLISTGPRRHRRRPYPVALQTGSSQGAHAAGSAGALCRKSSEVARSWAAQRWIRGSGKGVLHPKHGKRTLQLRYPAVKRAGFRTGGRRETFPRPEGVPWRKLTP